MILSLLCIAYAVEYEAVWPSDVHRFQYTIEQIQSVRELAQQQHSWMDSQARDYALWQRLIESQEYRLQAWGHLQSIKEHTAESPWSLESWLSELRDLIGRDNYYRGILPDPRIIEYR